MKRGFIWRVLIFESQEVRIYIVGEYPEPSSAALDDLTRVLTGVCHRFGRYAGGVDAREVCWISRNRTRRELELAFLPESAAPMSELYWQAPATQMKCDMESQQHSDEFLKEIAKMRRQEVPDGHPLEIHSRIMLLLGVPRGERRAKVIGMCREMLRAVGVAERSRRYGVRSPWLAE